MTKITIDKALLKQAIDTLGYYASVCGEDDQDTPAKQAQTALRAALAEPVGWLPIETAPRYGRLLVTGTEIGTCVASAGWDTETPESIKWGVVNEIYVAPTHWMPLPPVSCDTSPPPPAEPAVEQAEKLDPLTQLQVAYVMGLRDANSAPQPAPQQEPRCNPHPKAPHGFDRNSSHSAHRYVCECESWEPYDAGYNDGFQAGLKAEQALCELSDQTQEMEAQPRKAVNLTGEEVGMLTVFDPLVPVTPNESGETLCIVRWMVETPNGWVGAYDKGALEALFQKVETHERTD